MFEMSNYYGIRYRSAVINKIAPFTGAGAPLAETWMNVWAGRVTTDLRTENIERSL
jgi:hypothetical protein